MNQVDPTTTQRPMLFSPAPGIITIVDTLNGGTVDMNREQAIELAYRIIDLVGGKPVNV